MTENGLTLRGVEPRDIGVMYSLENDLRNWSISGTAQPFSKYLLELFVESQSGGDIFSTRQLRLMVDVGSEGDEDGVVGIVDLFDFDPLNHRAGVGVIILEAYRGRGYGGAALKMLHDYCRDVLHLHQMWCGVAVDNAASRTLFERAGYSEVGVKREWLYRGDGLYVDEVLYQIML